MIDFEVDSGGEAPEGDSLKRLAALVLELRTEEYNVARLDEELQAAEQFVRRLSEEDIPGLLSECGLQEMKLLDGSKVTVSAELDCGITEERRSAAMRWLRGNNLDGIIKTSVAVQFGRGSDEEMLALVARLHEEGMSVAAIESVHYQTLKATLKEERAAGRNVPEELFNLRPYSKAKVTPPPGVSAPRKPRKRK